jgi:hypothetical protein
MPQPSQVSPLLPMRLVPAFGKLRLRDVTRHRIDAYIAAQHAGRKVSVKTINNSLIPLRQILARCVRVVRACQLRTRSRHARSCHRHRRDHVLRRSRLVHRVPCESRRLAVGRSQRGLGREVPLRFTGLSRDLLPHGAARQLSEPPWRGQRTPWRARRLAARWNAVIARSPSCCVQSSTAVVGRGRSRLLSSQQA